MAGSFGQVSSDRSTPTSAPAPTAHTTAAITIKYDLPVNLAIGRVYLADVSGRAETHKSFVSGKGELKWDDLPEGTHEIGRALEVGIGANIQTLRFDVRTIKIKAGENHLEEFPIAGSHPLRGRAVVLDGQPLPLTFVIIRSTTEAPREPRRYHGGAPAIDVQVCDSAGRFETSSLKAGNYIIEVETYIAEPNLKFISVRKPTSFGRAEFSIVAESAPAPIVIEVQNPPGNVPRGIAWPVQIRRSTSQPSS